MGETKIMGASPPYIHSLETATRAAVNRSENWGSSQQIMRRVCKAIRSSLRESFRQNPVQGEFVYRDIRRRLHSLIGTFQNTQFTPESLTAQIHTILDASGYERLSSESPVIVSHKIIDMADICRRYDIPLIPPGMAYMGGTARILARHILSIEPNPLDILKDLDVYYAAPIALEEIIEHFTRYYSEHLKAKVPSFEPEGIQCIPNLDINTIEHIFRGRDITINQIVVTRDTLYITQKAVSDLKSGSVSMGGAIRDKYGVYQTMTRLGGSLPMYTARQIYRMAKVLIEGKAETMSIPEYGVLPTNLALFGDRYWFLLLHRILEVRDPNTRYTRIARYIEFLRQIELVDSVATGLQYLGDLYSHPEYQSWLRPSASAERNLTWMASKMTGVEFALFAEETDLEEERLPWRTQYITKPNRIKAFTIPLSFGAQKLMEKDSGGKGQAEFEYSVDRIADRQVRPHTPSYFNKKGENSAD